MVEVKCYKDFSELCCFLVGVKKVLVLFVCDEVELDCCVVLCVEVEVDYE